jgi:hypothetical protein
MRHVAPSPHNRAPSAGQHLSVLGIFRNEAHVLAEWIEHYRLFGVERFYLIDNNSTDEFSQILRPFQERGLVELYSCRKDGYQIGAYEELMPALRSATDWLGVFDLDEFIYPPGGEQLPAVLRRFEDCDAVLTPWLSFGSNGHMTQPSSTIQGFTRRGEAGVSRAFLKPIFRPAEVEKMSQHNPATRRGRKRLSNGEPFGDDLHILLDEARVGEFALLNNHYRLQSREHFATIKANRPEVHEEAQNRRKQLSFFDEYDELWSRVADSRLADIHRQRRAETAAVAAYQGVFHED